MAVSALSAARSLCEMREWKLSNLELQKILYLAHMYHLGAKGGPLIDGHFEAWDYGPVSPAVYARAKGFGAGAVGNVFHSIEPVQKNSAEYESLSEMADATKKMSAGDLVNHTHWTNGAWAACYKEGVRGIKIPDEAIRAEYGKRLARHAKT